MKNKLKFSICSLFLMGIVIILSSCKANNTIKDIDGNIYKTVKIGSQVWMVENLKTTKYKDGTPIPNVTDSRTWSNLTTGAYCDYENTPENSTIFGRLYNWYAAIDSRGICPKGWHVSSDNEWTTLTTFLGGKENGAGGKLKEIGITHWKNPNTDATDETGLTALPGGNRSEIGPFGFIGEGGYWWSLNMGDIGFYELRYMSYDDSNVYCLNIDKNSGFSVRCVRDKVRLIDRII